MPPNNGGTAFVISSTLGRQLPHQLQFGETVHYRRLGDGQVRVMLGDDQPFFEVPREQFESTFIVRGERRQL